MTEVRATPFHVAPDNAQQAAAWDGSEGDYWAAHADAFDASLADYEAEFLAAAELRGQDRVLDVGCGAGRTSIDAARLAERVVGVDLSSAMLEVARRRALEAGVTNVEFLQADAQVHRFAELDVAISRTGAMFFADPLAAFTNLARGLEPGGRLVLLVWQGPERNEWIRAILGALAAGREIGPPPVGVQGPFALADRDRTSRLLAEARFRGVEVVPVEHSMHFGRTADEATSFVLGMHGWMLADLDEPARVRAVDHLARTMAEHESADGVSFGSGMWLVTARR